MCHIIATTILLSAKKAQQQRLAPLLPFITPLHSPCLSLTPLQGHQASLRTPGVPQLYAGMSLITLITSQAYLCHRTSAGIPGKRGRKPLPRSGQELLAPITALLSNSGSKGSSGGGTHKATHPESLAGTWHAKQREAKHGRTVQTQLAAAKAAVVVWPPGCCSCTPTHAAAHMQKMQAVAYEGRGACMGVMH
eukprot:1148955-Pelagomonas_calceolata.AAC.3